MVEADVLAALDAGQVCQLCNVQCSWSAVQFTKLSTSGRALQLGQLITDVTDPEPLPEVSKSSQRTQRPSCATSSSSARSVVRAPEPMHVCTVGFTIVAAPTRTADAARRGLHPCAYSSCSDWGKLQSNVGRPAIRTGKGRGQVDRLLKSGMYLENCTPSNCHELGP